MFILFSSLALASPFKKLPSDLRLVDRPKSMSDEIRMELQSGLIFFRYALNAIHTRTDFNLLYAESKEMIGLNIQYFVNRPLDPTLKTGQWELAATTLISPPEFSLIDGPANFRKTPNGELLGQWAQGTIGLVLKKSGDWFFAISPKGDSGWTSKSNVFLVPSDKLLIPSKISDAELVKLTQFASQLNQSRLDKINMRCPVGLSDAEMDGATFSVIDNNTLVFSRENVQSRLMEAYNVCPQSKTRKKIPVEKPTMVEASCTCYSSDIEGTQEYKISRENWNKMSITSCQLRERYYTCGVESESEGMSNSLEGCPVSCFEKP